MRSDISSEAKDYPKELTAAQKAGLPLKMSDLARPLPPADQNAATYYMAFMSRIKNHPLSVRDQAIEHISDQLQSPKQIAALGRAISDRADLVHLVHEAASTRRCVFAKNWAMPDPYEISYRELSHMREAARILTAESLVLAAQGKTIQAVETEALVFRMAVHAAADPAPLGFDESLGLDGIAMRQMQKIIYMSHGDPKIAALVQKTVEHAWHPPSAFASERIAVAYNQGEVDLLRHRDYSVLVAYSGEGGPQLPPNGGPGWPTWSQFLDANDAFLLKEEMRLAASADKPYSQAKATEDAVDTDLQNPDKLSHLVANVQITFFFDSRSRAELAAAAEETEAGAAVLVWKGAHGAYPATLSQALPKVPIDPFDLKPLRYRKESKGFVIYSVGSTGKFNGDSPPTPPYFDIGFRYPLPAYLAAKNP